VKTALDLRPGPQHAAGREASKRTSPASTPSTSPPPSSYPGGQPLLGEEGARTSPRGPHAICRRCPLLAYSVNLFQSNLPLPCTSFDGHRQQVLGLKRLWIGEQGLRATADRQKYQGKYKALIVKGPSNLGTIKEKRTWRELFKSAIWYLCPRLTVLYQQDDNNEIQLYSDC